jgi:hypothetical protein
VLIQSFHVVATSVKHGDADSLELQARDGAQLHRAIEAVHDIFAAESRPPATVVYAISLPARRPAHA